MREKERGRDERKTGRERDVERENVKKIERGREK